LRDDSKGVYNLFNRIGSRNLESSTQCDDIMSSESQPKGRFYTRINEHDDLGLTIWSGKSDPTAEVIVVQLRRRDGDNWETVGRLAVYRTSDGVYSKRPERK